MGGDGGWPVRVPVGYRVGRYEVVAPIAHGSWGSVYAGRRLGADPPGDVALKFLPAQRGTPAQWGALADVVGRELAAAGRWEHPNLIRTHEALTVRDPAEPAVDGSLAVVMDLAVGSLADRLRAADPGRPLDGAERILAGVLAGLAHLHGAGWLHGDLKPANVLLCADGTARLADFGLAAELDGTHAYLPQFGSTDYLPPERWTEHSTAAGSPVRPTADLWAFGITAHLVLTGGRHPFPGAGQQPRQAAVLAYARGAEPLRLAEQLPDGWRQIVTDCLAPDHAGRARHSARTLLARVAALPEPSPPRAPKRLRAVLAARVGAVALVAVLAAASGPPYGSWTSGGDLRADAAVPAEYRPVIENAAHSFDRPAVSPALIAAILATASGFDPNARGTGVDGTPEYGIAGWTPRVYAGYALDARGDGHPSYLDPVDAIYALANQLTWEDEQLSVRPGDRALLLAAGFHTSLWYVRSTGCCGPNNAGYVARVRGYLQQFTDPRNGRPPGAPP
ncbi:serine/threonine protein kinase [Kitasatospora sp. MAA4]|uniref:serine/threonine-protein kinase n=1 Tax=Kitasatospora sp. MAA4 TaxID=3035093 RepID=UPI00247444E4|nr:serine/threonine-protein kinase [Kitasatospora sp. MAA4]MDH6132574.1 serine/threonine protein kinase [Kitasatospora sp. MAA4]